MSFELPGGLEAGRRFVEATELFSHLANVGDVRSLIIHPASTTHSQLSESELASSGVTQGLVRLSIGLESVADLLADLDLAFASLAACSPWVPGNRAIPPASGSSPVYFRGSPFAWKEVSRSGRSRWPTNPGASPTGSAPMACCYSMAFLAIAMRPVPGNPATPPLAGGTS